MTVFFFNRHFRFISALTVILLIVLASPALATTSRINSLGGNGDLFEDDANARRWFGSLTDYPDQASLESGNFNIGDGYWQSSSQKASGPGIGVHYGVGRNNNLGTVALFYGDHNDDHNFSMVSQKLRNNLSIVYAYDFGPLTAGAFFSHGSRDFELANVEIDYSANNVGLGVRMNLGDSAYLDLAWESQFTNLQNSSFNDGEGTNSETNYNLRSRAFIALGKYSALVPTAEIIHEDRLHPFVAPIHLENRLTHVGCGLNYYPDTDHLLLLGAEYIDGQSRNIINDSYGERTWSVWSLKAGFESRVLSWLTTRGSVGGFFENRKFPPVEEPNLRINLGLSLHLGAADLDVNFGEQYPERVYLGTRPDPQKPWLSATARILF